jgi:hypothetical protein
MRNEFVNLFAIKGVHCSNLSLNSRVITTILTTISELLPLSLLQVHWSLSGKEQELKWKKS